MHSRKIELDIVECESTICDPREDFRAAVQKFQVRTDPLTKRTCHISRFGAIRPQKLPFERYEKSPSAVSCPFCPQMRDRATPRYADSVVRGGRVARGEALLVPNLYPYDVYNPVTIMTRNHVVPLAGLTEGVLRDAFSLSVEFLRTVRVLDSSLRYHIVVWNYMPPGGLVHPHQQCIVTSHPGNQYAEELRASESFYHLHGVNYWVELIEEEKETGERYIAGLSASHWLAPFGPLGVLGDIMGIFPDVFSIGDFSDAHIGELVSALLIIFRYYAANDMHSFNASLFFGPAGQKSFSCHLRISPRAFLDIEDGTGDLNFYQMLLSEPVSGVFPEDLCKSVKPFFIGEAV